MRYTGSGPLALATALRKDRTKALLRAHGVPTPAARRQRRRRRCRRSCRRCRCIVKPTREDASTGIALRSVVRDAAALAARVAALHARYRQPT